MAKSGKKAAHALILAKKLVRLKRADGGETDPLMDSDYTSPPDKPNYVMSTEATKPVLTPNTFYERANSVLKERARDFGQGLSEMPGQAWEAIKYPMQALRGETSRAVDPNTGKIVDVSPSGMTGDEAAMVGAGLVSTGALPDIMAGKVTPNVSRVFAGPLSKTADLVALEKAQAMAAQGAEHSDILKQTGWFKGADNKWRYEIPDINAKVNMEILFGQDREDIARKYFEDKGLHPDYLKTTMYPGQSQLAFQHADRVLRSQRAYLENILTHPDFFEAYPLLKTAQVRENFEHKAGGAYDPTTDQIHILRGMGEDQTRSTMLHEIQHAIQDYENFGKGATQEIINANPKSYKNSAGEVESRNVQSRRNMTAEELRQNAPWDTQDVPYSEQIVTHSYANGGTVGDKKMGQFGHKVKESKKINPLIDTALMLVSRKT